MVVPGIVNCDIMKSELFLHLRKPGSGMGQKVGNFNATVSCSGVPFLS